MLVLLILSAVSFDGLSNTFWWLSLAGINPLEFPGRTAVMGLNTLGLTDLLVNGQYAALVLNDPLGRGWNLIGLRDFHVTQSLLNTAGGALAIFSIQTAATVTGHMLSVAVAHRLVIGMERGARLVPELPLAFLMVACTAFGPWLLSAPAIG